MHPRTLRRGHQGPAVTVVQRALNVQLPRHLQRLNVNGTYDDDTEDAVRRFQNCCHLHQTGQVDGRTYSRLFGIRPLHLVGNLQLRGTGGAGGGGTPPLISPAREQVVPLTPSPTPTPVNVPTNLNPRIQPPEGPRPFQIQAQAGGGVATGGWSYGVSLGFMMRQQHYGFSPGSDRHPEHALALSMQSPTGPGGIFTGQLMYTYTLADMLAPWRFHIFSPFAGAFVQFPFNSDSRDPAMSAAMPDAASHVTAGAALGNTVSFDIVKNYLTLNVQHQVVGFVDTNDRTFHFDTSVMFFLQGTIGVGRRMPPQEPAGN